MNGYIQYFSFISRFIFSQLSTKSSIYFHGIESKLAVITTSINNYCLPLGQTDYYKFYQLGLPSLTTRGHSGFNKKDNVPLQTVGHSKVFTSHIHDSNPAKICEGHNVQICHSTVNHVPKWQVVLDLDCFTLFSSLVFELF